MARGEKRKGSFQDDRLVGSLFDDTLAGGGGDDTLVGKRNDDRLVGQAGRDLLKGAAGDDALFGGGGNDRLLGGGGNDMLVGAAGDDLAKGGGGKDTVKGGGGNDRLFGNGGADRLLGNGGNDDLFGGGGNDKLFGGAGRDDLTGGGGRDDLSGGGGNDKLFGGAGNDKLTGGGGGDRLVGGAGNDRMFGGKGNDTLTGDAGDDMMSGGAGADVFVFDAADAGPSTDTILDFAAGVDRISLAGFNNLDTFDDLTIADTANGAVVSLGGGRQIVLRGVTEGELSGADFGLGPRQVQSGPPVINGGSGDDTLTGTAASELIRGFGGNDVIGTSGGVDTLVGGSGADKFVIRLEGGQIGAGVDIVEDFQYALGDVIGLTEALSGVAYSNISEVVRATPQTGGTMIAVNRGDGFKDALFLKGVAFTTEQLQNYGFSAPALGSAAFVDNPYGFTNISNTTTDPTITPDGMFVAFVSKENNDNLAGDITPFKTFDPDLGTVTNEDQATQDVFVRNMATGAIQRASTGPGGAAVQNDDGTPATSVSPAISANGRFVAFATSGQAAAGDGNASGDVYVRDLLLDTAPVLVSVGANGSTAAGGVPIGFDFVTASGAVLDISADGRRIAFVTDANIAANDTNGERDVYLRDLDTGTTELVSVFYQQALDTNTVAGGDVGEPYDDDAYAGDVVAMSANGRYVAYATASGHASNQTIIPSFSYDFDGGFDVYLRDTLLDRTILVSGTNGKDVTGLDISDDGSRIVFATAGALDADDRNNPDNSDFEGVDVYLSEVDLAAFGAADIRSVNYTSFVETRRISEAAGGFELKGGSSFAPSISPDGQRVGFVSNATDITPAGPNTSLFVSQKYYEVDLATGAVSVIPNAIATAVGGGSPDSYLKAHDLSNDGVTLRVGGNGGDTIGVTSTVSSAVGDVPSDGSGSVILQTPPGPNVLRGTLASFADVDSYLVSFNSSTSKIVSVEGVATNAGTLLNPSVRIREVNSNGDQTNTFFDADSGIGSNAYVRFTPNFSSSYFIDVLTPISLSSPTSGTYRVTVTDGAPVSGPDTPVILQLDTPFSSSVAASASGNPSGRWFQFDTGAGGRFQANLVEGGLDNGVIRIRDDDGSILASSSAGAATFDFFAPSGGGQIFVEVDTAVNADAGSFTIEIEEDPFIFIPIPLPPIVIGAAEPEPLAVSQLDEGAAWLL